MMTCLAVASFSASAAASMSWTSPAGAAGLCPALGAGVAPNPPKMTFQIDRFIALHMM